MIAKANMKALGSGISAHNGMFFPENDSGNLLNYFEKL